MTRRISPSFVIAVLALVLAGSGVGYAAGRIGSAQIKDNSIQSKDVRNGSLRGIDLKRGSLGRSTDYTRCRTGEVFRFGTCIRTAQFGPSSYQAAISNCSDIGGAPAPTVGAPVHRCPHRDVRMGQRNPSQYEFSGDFTGDPSYTPVARDRGGNYFDDASAQSFWHHCLTLR